MTTKPVDRRNAQTIAQRVPCTQANFSAGEAPPEAGAGDRVLEQAGDRHRPDAAGDRRQVGGHVRDAGIDVADEARLGPVDADVDDGRARLDHVRRDDGGAARRHHEHVRVEGMAGEVARVRMADGDGCVRLLEQLRDRLPDDRAAADDDGPRAVELDPVLGEQRHHAARRCRDEPRPREEQLTGVQRVESVHVLQRVDGADHALLVDAARQRQLHEQRVDRLVGVQLRDLVEQVVLRDRVRQPQVGRTKTGRLGRLVLAADVDVRRRVVADENGRKADTAEDAHLLGHLRADAFRQRTAGHRRGGHSANVSPMPWPRKNDPASIRARQALTGIDGLPASVDLAPFTHAAEALTGVAVIPVSVCPVRVELGTYALSDAGDVVEQGRGEEDVLVPLAHTEGSLTLSMTRGARAAGVVKTYVLADRITRASCFVCADARAALELASWIEGELPALQEWLRGQDDPTLSKRAVLREVKTHVIGPMCHVLWSWTTGDAVGPNMMTRNAYALNMGYVMQRAPVKPERAILEANMGGDKKPSYEYFHSGHGKT